jgi:hypothetical protein
MHWDPFTDSGTFDQASSTVSDFGAAFTKLRAKTTEINLINIIHFLLKLLRKISFLFLFIFSVDIDIK